MTPHVSVVLPVRNGARWLGEALRSVEAQTFAGWELIAIDDGSTDATPDILKEFGGRDSRILAISQLPLGLVAALNRGLAEARGPLIARLDADDRALPERLNRQVRHLESNPAVGLLGTWAREIAAAGNRRGQLRPPAAPDDLQRLLIKANPFVHSSMMFRTELARRLGGFRPAFRAAEDYDLWLRISETAQIANLPDALVEYRVHDSNVTSLNAIRQAFSVRLAKRCALARRAYGRDPADALAGPPDWRSAEADGSFYAEDAALYRLLDLADPDIAAGACHAADFSLLEARFGDLTHAERALAASAMMQHLTRAEPSHARQTRGVLLRLLRRRPGMMSWPLLRRMPAALLR